MVLYCVPKDASWPQLINLVKWLEENPDKLNLSGYDAILLAMSKSYPCARRPTKDVLRGICGAVRTCVRSRARNGLKRRRGILVDSTIRGIQ